MQGKTPDVFRSSSQIVVCAPRRSCDSVHLRNLIDELFHILDVGVWRVLRIDFGRIQNNDLHPIRPQCLQRSGNAAGLVGRLAEAAQARPIYSGGFVLLCFMLQLRAMVRTASASVTISLRGT